MPTPRVERPAMADYGVPADPDGALPWTWAAERLIRSRNLWVVTVDTRQRPHAMPVWGVWLETDPHQGFWFGCAPSSYKARNLAVNPHVTVAADDTVEVVSVDGVAATVDPPESVIAVYIDKYWPDTDDRPGHEEFLRSHPMFHVTPHRVYGMIEREEEFSTKATRWVWPDAS